MIHILTEFLNLVCATIIAMIVPLGIPISLLLCCLLLFTTFRWLLLLYIIWIVLVDWTVQKEGGRPNNKFLKLLWNRAENYYPVKYVFIGDFNLDPRRNYLLCAFPHGFISVGMQIFNRSTLPLISDFFKNHKRYLATLNLNFYIPFQRELLLILGFVSVSANSLKYILCHPSGGNILQLVPGGVEEALYCNPYKYKFVLKKRKGFVKLALLTGAPLIPVISFGENNVYNIVDNYYLHKFGKFLKKITRVSLIIPIGRWFTLVPNKVNITILFGEPIEVQNIEKPTQQEIDYLHNKFIDRITYLFQTQKHEYLAEAEKITLEII